MEKKDTPLQDLYVLQPNVFVDDRGYFFESFNQRAFNLLIGEGYAFMQDNQSCSKKGVLRGLHFQNPPHAQGKLVSVISGAVLDVAVDIRKSSPTYGQHYSIELTGDNKTMLWIPPGFAHGFLTLYDNTIFSYKCSNYYHKASEDAIHWNSPELNINWGTDHPLVSEKDQEARPFGEFVSSF